MTGDFFSSPVFIVRHVMIPGAVGMEYDYMSGGYGHPTLATFAAPGA